MIYDFSLRRFLYFLKEHSELCDFPLIIYIETGMENK